MGDECRLGNQCCLRHVRSVGNQRGLGHQRSVGNPNRSGLQRGLGHQRGMGHGDPGVGRSSVDARRRELSDRSAKGRSLARGRRNWLQGPPSAPASKDGTAVHNPRKSFKCLLSGSSAHRIVLPFRHQGSNCSDTDSHALAVSGFEFLVCDASQQPTPAC